MVFGLCRGCWVHGFRFKTVFGIAIIFWGCSSTTDRASIDSAVEGAEFLEPQDVGKTAEDMNANGDDAIEGVLDQVETGEPSAEALKSNLEDEPLEVLEIEEAIDPATRGLVRFFSGLDRGLVVSEIDWGAPLSRSNPGIDCRLKRRGPGLYSCLVVNKGTTLVLTVREQKSKVDPTQRQLARITLDGKGFKEKQRIESELEALKFRSIGESKKNSIDIVSYAFGNKTRADVLWVQKKTSFTLILRPFALQSERAKAIKKAQPANRIKTKVPKAKAPVGQ
jgi:hypothetical protein